MQPIDVVLIDLPEVLSDILKSVLDREADIRVLGHLPDCRALLDASEEPPPHVAIVGNATGDLPAPCRTLLEQGRPIKVLTVGGDGREASLYELRPYRVPLGELSPDSLIGAIRATRSARVPEGPGGG